VIVNYFINLSIYNYNTHVRIMQEIIFINLKYTKTPKYSSSNFLQISWSAIILKSNILKRGGSMDINLEEIFEEPAHSKSFLLDFQEKYNIDSDELYLFYQQNGINCEKLPITEKNFKPWIHHFIIFKEI